MPLAVGDHRGAVAVGAGGEQVHGGARVLGAVGVDEDGGGGDGVVPLAEDGRADGHGLADDRLRGEPAAVDDGHHGEHGDAPDVGARRRPARAGAGARAGGGRGGLRGRRRRLGRPLVAGRVGGTSGCAVSRPADGVPGRRGGPADGAVGRVAGPGAGRALRRVLLRRSAAGHGCRHE